MHNRERIEEIYRNDSDWPREGDVYRHFKGDLYVVVTCALDADTLTPMVVYVGLAPGEPYTWVRTVAAWNEVVEMPTGDAGVRRFQKRFEKVEDDGRFRDLLEAADRVAERVIREVTCDRLTNPGKDQ